MKADPRHGRRPSSRGSSGSQQRRDCDVDLWPRPLIDLGLVDPVLVGVALAIDLYVAQLLFDMRAGNTKPRHAIDDVDGEAETIDLVSNGQIERRVDVALLLVAAHVQILVIRAPICQPM